MAGKDWDRFVGVLFGFAMIGVAAAVIGLLAVVTILIRWAL